MPRPVMASKTPLAVYASRLEQIKSVLGRPVGTCRLKRGDALKVRRSGNQPVCLVDQGWIWGVQDFGGLKAGFDLAMPGMFVGYPMCTSVGESREWVAAGNAKILEYDRERIATKNHQLAILLKAQALELALLRDRLDLFSKATSEARMALIILQMMDRLQANDRRIYDRFRCPLTQTQLGHLLGIGNVHVSRLFSRFEANGALKRYKSFIIIERRSCLEMLCGYRNRFAELGPL